MKPKPVVVETICSECGLDWDRHEEAALSECVRLLKADLASRPKPVTWTYPWTQPHVYYPNTWPYRINDVTCTPYVTVGTAQNVLTNGINTFVNGSATSNTLACNTTSN